MPDADRCTKGGPTKKNGNCTVPDPGDGLPVQCVGRWAEDKHDYLGRYIDATREVRKKFLARPGAPAGGAAFIDLFAGPGRARIRSSGALIDGTPLLALNHSEAPFTRVILCDLDPENAAALRTRTHAHRERTEVVEGDSNARIDQVMRFVPQFGLNLALIDPFSLSQLKFDTLARLAQVRRMDLLIHFPTMDIKRNLEQGARALLAEAVGSSDLDHRILGPKDTVKAIEELRSNLSRLGYTGAQVRSVSIKNDSNGLLYHLVYVSKDPKGDKIWNSIAKTTGRGQKSLL